MIVAIVCLAMCLLIVLRGFHPRHPILVGANRDELRSRRAAPPGLWVGDHRKILSPRDRVAGGTWLAIDDRGWFAGLTNWKHAPDVDGAPSRGHLPHLALQHDDLDAAADFVAERVFATPHSGFQLVLCDARRTLVLRHAAGGMQRIDWQDRVLVITNEHGPGEFTPRGLEQATMVRPGVEAQLDALLPLLADRSEDGEHVSCKRGEDYGTVSSSLVAIPSGDPRRLYWRFAAGPPDSTSYRNYGNLGRRLLPEE